MPDFTNAVTTATVLPNLFDLCHEVFVTLFTSALLFWVILFIFDAIDVPFLHLIDITAQAIAKQGLDKVGLLGTSFSMTDGFYQTTLAKYGIQTIIPNESDQQIVHRIIYDELCLNEIKPSAAEQYIQIIKTLKAQGAQAVILGCTEIGLLINEENSPLPVFDTTLMHIDAAVAWMLAQ